MAYTKYSLTPANNTATPPDGAPEGMLPSAVNDTMRDMMAQIRDCGDGIRDGTYTMTAPKITGGTITGAAFTGNTFTNPVISGGSINNTPIGATTANTGAFSTLSATGVTTVQAGTVSLPAITTSGDTNTGIYFPAADTIAFTEGGTEAMRINASGQVGIGTSSPTQQLDVTATSSATSIIVAQNTTATSGGAQLRAGNPQNLLIMGTDSNGGGLTGTANSSFFYTTSTSPIVFMPNATERMRITSAGAVLIGTTSTATSSTLNIDSAGYQPLYVNTTISGGGGAAFSRSGTQAMYVGTAGSSWLTGSSTADGLMRSEANMLFAIGNTERMRITSGGFLFVNTTSLVGDGYVSVSFNGSANVGMGLKSTHNGSFDVMRFVNYNNVQQGYINCNNSGSTTYNSGSDYRFKDNVKPMIDGLSKVMQLKPVTFNWKGDNSAGQGFIAHELAEIVPDVVSGEKDAVTEDGTIKPQGVDYGKLTAVLASAIQELNAKVEAQAARIAELESK